MATSSRRDTTNNVTKDRTTLNIRVPNLDRPTFVLLPRGKEATLTFPRASASALVYIQPDTAEQDTADEFIRVRLINANTSKDIATVVDVVRRLQDYEITQTGRR